MVLSDSEQNGQNTPIGGLGADVYRLAIEISPDAVIIFDKNLRVKMVNVQAAHLHRYAAPAEMIGLLAGQLVHSEDMPRLQAATLAASPNDHPVAAEYRFLRQDGSIVEVEANARTLFDDDGQFAGVIGIARDATARKKSERQLKKSDERNQLLLRLHRFSDEMSDEALLEYSLNQLVSLTDSQFGFIHQIAPDQKTISAIMWGADTLKKCDISLPPHSDLDTAGNWADAVRQMQPVIYNDFWSAPNKKGLPEGHVPIQRFLSVPVVDASRVVFVFTVGSKADLYDQDDLVHVQLVTAEVWKILSNRRAERALAESERRYRALFENSPVAMFRVETTGKIVDVSQEFLRLIGSSVDDAFLWQEAFLQDFIFEPSNLKLEDGSCEHLFSARSGQTFVGVLTLRGFYDQQAQLQYFEGFVEDITARQRAEQALHASEDKFFRVFEYSPLLMTLSRLEDGTFLDVNRQFCKISGFSRGEAIGSTSVELGWVSAQDRQLILDGVSRYGYVRDLELLLTARDNRKVWCLYYGEVVEIEGQKRLLSIASDISERKKAIAALQQSEEKFHKVFENVAVGMALISLNGRFLQVNQAFCHILGYSADELIGEKWRNLVYEDDQALGDEKQNELKQNQDLRMRFLMRFVRKNDRVIFADVGEFLLRNEAMEPMFFVMNIQDVTARQVAEANLRESEDRYRSVVTALAEGIIVQERSGKVQMYNTSAENILGLAEDQMFGRAPLQPGWRVIYEDGSDFPVENYPPMQTLRTGHPCGQAVMGIQKPDGSLTWISVNTQPLFRSGEKLPYAVASSFSDITQHKKNEKQIRETLAEKETLLRELYHRTKNNMQVISSLLSLQQSYQEDPRLAAALEETVNRIQAMAMVHQKLYQSRNLSRLDLGEYISELAALLAQSYSLKAGMVDMIIDVDECPVLIDVAVPCGLIVNELVSNAFKYAFRDSQNGKLIISVHKQDGDMIVLSVSDNGPGLPAGFDPKRQGRLGMQTVFALGELQLQGKIKLMSENGLHCVVQFKDMLYSARV